MCLKPQQPPMTIKQQLQNLISLGLTIEDENRASYFLNDVSYFRFVKAYSLGLKAKNGNYNPDVSFDQLTELYLFNSNFRQLLFTQIERIEVNLRCRLANYFSYKYGVLGYKTPTNFNDPTYHQNFLDEIEREILRNKKSPFIQNFQRNYISGDIPFYALIELFSFGILSKFYKNMKTKIKKIFRRLMVLGIHILRAGSKVLPL